MAHEARSGRSVRFWRDELLQMREAPFPVDSNSLFVGYSVDAELLCCQQLGWPLPAAVLDLHAEFRRLRNIDDKREESRRKRARDFSGLLAACRHYGVPCMADDEKDRGRDLVLLREKQGRKAVELQREHTADERLQVLDYCGRDVAATSRLLVAMLDDIVASPRGLKGALGRGAFVSALAQMEFHGIPIDTATHERIRKAKPQIRAAIISEAGLEQFYLGTTFKRDRFAAWLDAVCPAWPRTEKGVYRMDEDTFTRQRDVHPLVPVLGKVLGDLRRLSKEKVSVGQDARNRCSLMPFGTKTGRCAPGAGFIFGRAAEYRHLIVAPPGRALLAFDYANQELKIAACLSDDEALIESCRTADPYMDFAIDESQECGRDLRSDADRSTATDRPRHA